MNRNSDDDFLEFDDEPEERPVLKNSIARNAELIG